MPNVGSSPHDLNYVPGLIAQSSTGVRTDLMVELYADPTTHRLLVDALITTGLSAQTGVTNAQAVNAADKGVLAMGSDGSNYRLLKTLTDGTLVVSASVSNPSVGATGSAVPASANYIGFNSGGNLTAVSLGQQTAANSIPVILPSATITALTPPSNTGYALDASVTPIGAKTDAKSTATDGTSTSIVSILKQISASVQAPPSQAVTGTFWQSTQPVSIATAPVLVAGTAVIGKVTTDQTTHGTTDLVAADITKVGGAAVALGQTTMAASIPVTLASNQGNVPVAATPATSGGLLVNRLISAATTNATSAKGSVGQVYGWYLYNANAATRYLKLYNKATSPTVGTDVPFMTIPIPPGAAANVEYTNGIAFSTGIAFAITTGVADADTGAVAANEVVVNLLYK